MTLSHRSSFQKFKKIALPHKFGIPSVEEGSIVHLRLTGNVNFMLSGNIFQVLKSDILGQ